MHFDPQRPLKTACYHSSSRIFLLIGAALILAGVFLLIFCVPLWFYLAVIGAALIVLGLILLRK